MLKHRKIRHSIDLSELYFQLGISLSQQMADEKAVDFFNKSLSLLIKTKGEMHPKVVERLRESTSFSIILNNNAALDFAQQYHRLVKKIHVTKDLEHAFSDYFLAETFYKQSKPQQALRYANESIKKLLELQANDYTLWASNYRLIAEINIQLFKFDIALKNAKRGMKYARLAFEQIPLALVPHLELLSEVYLMRFDLEKAEKAVLEMVKIVRENESGHFLPRCLRKASMIYELKEDYDTALVFAQQELDYFERLPNHDVDWLNDIFITIGNLLLLLEKYDEAINYFLDSLDIYESEFDNPKILILYQYLTEAYRNTGELRKALEYSFFIEDFFENELPETYTSAKDSLILCRIDISDIYFNMDNIAKAFEYAGKAVEIAEKHLGDNFEAASAFELYADYLGDLLKLEESLYYYQKALSIYEEIYDEDGYEIGKLLYKISIVHYKLKNYQIAQNKANEARNVLSINDNDSELFKEVKNWQQKTKYTGRLFWEI